MSRPTHVNLSDATDKFKELLTSTRLVILHEYQVTLRLHHDSLETERLFFEQKLNCWLFAAVTAMAARNGAARWGLHTRPLNLAHAPATWRSLRWASNIERPAPSRLLN